MFKLCRFVRGGFLKGYRTQILGVATGAGGIINALAEWAVGDLSLIALVSALGSNWTLIAGGFGLATLGAKIERGQPRVEDAGQSVSDIAARALRP